MAEESGRGQTGELNAIGNPVYVGQRLGAEPGGNPDKGYLDQCMPTAIIARGQDVSSKDDFAKGVRRQMSSVEGNRSLAKRDGSRR